MRARADPSTSREHIGRGRVCPSPVTRSCDGRCYFEVPRSVFDEFPSGESGLEVVPVADVAAFAHLPAEIDLTPPALPADGDHAAPRDSHPDTERGDDRAAPRAATHAGGR